MKLALTLVALVVLVALAIELLSRVFDHRKHRTWTRRRDERILAGIKERRYGAADEELPAFLRPQSPQPPNGQDEYHEKVLTYRQFVA